MPAPGCALVVQDVQAGCTDDIDPLLTYALSLPVPATEVQITVTDGRHSAQVSGPPSGSVAWPATVTGRSATVTFATGTTPAYTASVSVPTPGCVSEVLDNNPATPTPTSPAGGTSGDNGSAATTTGSGTTAGTGSGVESQVLADEPHGVLASTGAQVGAVAGVATVLLVAGGVVFWASRRRHA